MRRILTVAAILAMLIFPIAQRAAADVQVGLSVGEDGIKGFYLAIGEHYQVPEKEIVVVPGPPEFGVAGDDYQTEARR
jgi:hypothetical protein